MSDSPILREAVVAATRKVVGVSRAISCESSDSAIVLESERPSLAIVDFGAGGVERIVLCSTQASIAVLVIQVTDDDSRLISCAEAGATNFLSQSDDEPNLVSAVGLILARQAVCSSSVATRLIRRISAQVQDGRGSGRATDLTSRERDVWRLIARGQSNKEISSTNIAESTVKHHVHHLLAKLHVRTRQQAIAKAIEHASADKGVIHD